jgi:hypothetical protein
VTIETHPTRAAEDGGPDKVLAAVAALGQATAAEVAEHAGLGYSTVTARLRKLAEAGTVHKQTSGTGPTRWRPADPAAEPDTQPEPVNPPEEAEPDQPESTVNEASASEQVQAEPDQAGHDPTEPTTVEPGTGRDPASRAAPSGADATGDHATSDASHEEPAAAPTGHDAKPAGGTTATRRPPGKLREQVLGVLQDHPDQPFTPHQISKLLDGASSGAIVLACRKLAGEGSVKQVRERPATFQAE